MEADCGVRVCGKNGNSCGGFSGGPDGEAQLLVVRRLASLCSNFTVDTAVQRHISAKSETTLFRGQRSGNRSDEILLLGEVNRFLFKTLWKGANNYQSSL